MTVDGIEFIITDAFGEGLYNSCKDVKFGTMNTRAIDFIGAGAKTFKGNQFFWNCILSLLSLSLSYSHTHACMHWLCNEVRNMI